MGGGGNVLPAPPFNGLEVPVSPPRWEYVPAKFNETDKHFAPFWLQGEFVICQNFKQLPQLTFMVLYTETTKFLAPPQIVPVRGAM